MGMRSVWVLKRTIKRDAGHGTEVKAFCFGNVECEELQDIQMGVLSMHLDMRVRSSWDWLGMS